MNREVVNAVKTTATSAVHRAEEVVSGAHSEQKPHNEQKSSGENKNRNNWHILASRSGSRSARNKQMLRAKMPPWSNARPKKGAEKKKKTERVALKA